MSAFHSCLSCPLALLSSCLLLCGWGSLFWKDREVQSSNPWRASAEFGKHVPIHSFLQREWSVPGEFCFRTFLGIWIIVTTSRRGFTFCFLDHCQQLATVFFETNIGTLWNRKKEDFVHKSLLCLTSTAKWKITVCFYKLRILLDYYFFFLFVIRGDLWDLLWIHTKFFFWDKLRYIFHELLNDAKLSTKAFVIFLMIFLIIGLDKLSLQLILCKIFWSCGLGIKL